MKTPIKAILLTAASVATINTVNAQTTGFPSILVTGEQHNAAISQAVYIIDGQEVIQNADATSISATNDQILLKSLTVDDNGTLKTLNHFNFDGTISNVNFTGTESAIGVVSGGVVTTINALPTLAEGVKNVTGLEEYKAALQTTLTNSNINNYAIYDTPNADAATLDGVNAAGFDFDINFANPFLADDFIAVAERNGNTFFELMALDINGNVITDANILRFDSESGGPGGYDFNTGFATANYIPSQPQYITVASASLFGVDEVYGFRVDNDGGADIKFFGISDTTFVPEPSSTLLLGLGGLTLIARRKK